jgi:hypothetical protein
MSSRPGREVGAATVELGIVLPVLLILVAGVAPLIKFGLEYMVLSRAVSHGLRYATRVDTNAHYIPDGVTLSRRPSAGEVQAFVRDAAGPLELSVADIAVVPDPLGALPGEPIKVEATYEVSFGLLADLANAAKDLLGLSADLADSKRIEVSVRGREE